MASVKSNVAVPAPVIRKIDQVDPNNIYIGLAKPGTATSSADWLIQKISTSSNIITITFASGTQAFDKVWDSRASYSYS